MNTGTITKDTVNNEDGSTRGRLLQIGMKLFAEYGFDATTTRMIAQAAGTNIATMSFHFGNKEGYYHEVLVYTAKQVASHYEPLGKRIREANETQDMTPAMAWNFIEEYVDLVLSIVANLKETEPLSLLFHEQNRHPFDDYPITQVVCKEAEILLKNLLLTYWKSQDEQKAAVISRIINGSLITLGEHPIFIRRTLNMADDSVLPEAIINEIREYTLNSIRTY